MSYTIVLEEGPTYLHVKVTGENAPENVQSYLAEIYKICAEKGFSSVLIEENLSGPSLDPADVYNVITKASSLTSPIVNMIAYVDVNPEHTPTIAALGEAVARDRGANVRVFKNNAEAAAWLTSGE